MISNYWKFNDIKIFENFIFLKKNFCTPHDVKEIEENDCLAVSFGSFRFFLGNFSFKNPKPYTNFSDKFVLIID